MFTCLTDNCSKRLRDICFICLADVCSMCLAAARSMLSVVVSFKFLANVSSVGPEFVPNRLVCVHFGNLNIKILYERLRT